MEDKRQTPVGFKLSEREKEAAEEVAAKFGHKPGSLAGMLLRGFVDSYKQHGEQLKFPPEFNYFTSGETAQSSQKKRDASAKAG